MVHTDSFTASSVSSDRTRWIRLTGEFDLGTAPFLGDELKSAAACHTSAVVLDLSRLTFIDCAGLRAVFDFTDSVRARGWLLRIVSPPPHIARVVALLDAARDPVPAVPTPGRRRRFRPRTLGRLGRV